MSDNVDCIVIGAGVIGLAVARKMALQGREVLVLEEADAIGTGVSARNSEVIHAGLYYPQGSLKARLCVAGRTLLYDYLNERGINYKRCGKLLVATNEEEEQALDGILEKARINGVDDLSKISQAEALALEPKLSCKSALLSPSTGVLDTHAYMLNLQGDAENNGATFAFLSSVVGGRIEDGTIELDITGVDGTLSLGCKTLINAAGLGAQKVASSIKGFPPELVPPQCLAKGSYFTLNGKAPFSRLIYPIPGKASLGTHYTCDLGGQGRFGPDAQWVDEVNYDVDPARADSFYTAIRRYWPGIEDGALSPAYSGIRPKIQAPGEKTADFIIQDASVHGVNSLVNLFGIESPGLTSSMAIADEVASRL
jgi:L-2-hydroxyglutarate oxidase LhgO